MKPATTTPSSDPEGSLRAGFADLQTLHALDGVERHADAGALSRGHALDRFAGDCHDFELNSCPVNAGQPQHVADRNAQITARVCSRDQVLALGNRLGRVTSLNTAMDRIELLAAHQELPRCPTRLRHDSALLRCQTILFLPSRHSICNDSHRTLPSGNSERRFDL
jgi:hypothetical protein